MAKTIADRISQIENLLTEILDDYKDLTNGHENQIEELEDKIEKLEEQLADQSEKLEQALILAEAHEE